MTHVFKHPKFYRIPRDKKDQAISNNDGLAQPVSVRPDPGQNLTCDSNADGSEGSSLKLQATSHKHQAPSVKLSNQPVQAPSDKRPNQSNKRQASSHKQQAQ